MNRLVRVLAMVAVAVAAVVAARAELKVVASTSQVGDIVRQVAGDAVELTVLMGPGVDPHLYKATARDVMSLRRADVIFYNGLHLEGRLGETFSKIDRKRQRIEAVAERIPSERLLESANYADVHDPHVWFDPQLWAFAIDAVVETLVDEAPELESMLRSRGKAYRDLVLGLEAWGKERLSTIPEKRRVLVTSHDAYNYFGRAFGMEVVGVQGISTVTEAGMADVAKMSDYIKSRGIPAIFVESSVSPATIERISKDSGAVVGGELFSDALGAMGDLRQGSTGESNDVGTYVGMFRYNVETIVGALAR